MAGSDEGLQSALFNISDPAFEASPAVLGAPIPGILPGRIEKARRSAEAHDPGAAWTLFARRSRLLCMKRVVSKTNSEPTLEPE